jgi:hypothetical protein
MAPTAGLAFTELITVSSSLGPCSGSKVAENVPEFHPGIAANFESGMRSFYITAVRNGDALLSDGVIRFDGEDRW